MIYESPLVVESLVINYTFAGHPYKRCFTFINLGSNVDQLTVETLTSKFRKKSELGIFIQSLLGEERNGYVLLEISKMVPSNKNAEYTKIYETIKLIK